MKVIDRIKNIFIAIAVIVIMTTGVSVKADDEIQSGIYTVKNTVYHENETGKAMARNYVQEEMQVKVTKEGAVFTIGFTGTNYMNNFRIKINDVEVPAETIEENKAENSIKLQVSAPSKDVKIAARIYVDPMGRDVEFQIIPDFSTMTLVQAIEEVPTEVKEEVTEADSEEAKEVNNEELNESEAEPEESNNKMIIAGAAILIVVGISAIVISKKKN